VKAGSVSGAALAEIPAHRRFYSGGGGSVRGYSYQGVGPRDPNGNLTGGRSLLEASIELRFQVTEKLGLVPFVDAGSVSTGTVPGFSDVRIGAGIGVRYLTPVGPLRVDVGFPLDRRPGENTIGVYAGVGQAF
jgi:translocation and assembly module TamA